MYKILERRRLCENVVLMTIDAPFVAKKAEPGQFIILRTDEMGERIPLTIADFDREKGTVTIIFQEVGGTTIKLGTMQVGDSLQDFVGPLGVASHLECLKKVCVVGGGLGCAIAYPQAKKLHQLGAHVDLVAGFKNKDFVILEDEMKAASTNLILTTDDGSYGKKGFTTMALEELLKEADDYDMVIVIGPVIMMKFVCDITKKYGVKTIVSMNSTMIDGTGMCGGCRVTVGGETKFACVDGPDFDGHEVDFDEAIKRAGMYKEQEKAACDEAVCNLTKGVL